MKVEEIFDLAVKMGIDSDFRGREGVDKLLQRKKKIYQGLSDKAKKGFDQEALNNPYLDSRIYYNSNKNVKKAMVGIDIDPSELLIAKRLEDIDLVIAHHPLGRGLAHLADVMDLQCDVLSYYGVPINISEALMKIRIQEVARGVNGINHQRTPDAARLLDISLMNSHTPCDNLAAKFVKELIDEKNPEYVEEIIDVLNEVKEYEEALKIGAGAKVFVGSSSNKCGKVAVTEFTGGTEGSPKLYEKMAQAGIGTIIGMHMSEAHKKEAEQAHINVVIAGHMSSDSLGVNLFLDELEKKGVEIIPCSGLTRFKRT